jgi:hypothetical protein
MKYFAGIVLLGSLTILIFDTSAAAVSNFFQVNYALFSVVSSVIYGMFGFLTARRLGLAYAPICGALLGLVDATLGWYISAVIGPGAPATTIGPLEIGVTIIIVMGEAAAVALIGGLLSRTRTA